MAVNNNVRSPVAAEPNRNCSLRTCLQTRKCDERDYKTSAYIRNRAFSKYY